MRRSQREGRWRRRRRTPFPHSTGQWLRVSLSLLNQPSLLRVFTHSECCRCPSFPGHLPLIHLILAEAQKDMVLMILLQCLFTSVMLKYGTVHSCVTPRVDAPPPSFPRTPRSDRSVPIQSVVIRTRDQLLDSDL